MADIPAIVEVADVGDRSLESLPVEWSKVDAEAVLVVEHPQRQTVRVLQTYLRIVLRIRQTTLPRKLTCTPPSQLSGKQHERGDN